MAKIFTEECLHNIDSKFKLILLAVRRTREILNDEDVAVLQQKYDLYSAEAIALSEIAGNKLNIQTLHDSVLDKMVNEYRENHLMQAISKQNFDRDIDPQKMFKDIFKDELSNTDQDVDKDTSKDVGQDVDKDVSKDQSVASDQQNLVNIEKDNNTSEDDIISKVMQMDQKINKD